MADRNQNHPGHRPWRSDPDRSNRWRDENEGRYSSAEQDRDYDFDYTRNDEGDSSVRAGSFDQGRQYGRRDTNEQSGSTGRYAGYGNAGRGDYGRGGRNTGQGHYGQSGYGQGGYGTGSGVSANRDREDYDYGYGRQGGYGGNYGQGQYGQGGSRDRFSEPETGGRYSQGTFGTERGGWNEPYGEGQHRGKGPKGYQRSDERLKEMISERLREDPHIDASDITVTVQGSRVTLEGTVESRHTKNLVEDVAEQLGVADVQNNLRVQKQQDAWRSSGSSAASGSMSAGAGMSGSAATGSKGTTGTGGDDTESSRQKRN